MLQIYDGLVSDTTNHSSNKYLHINSCGFQNIISDYKVIRRQGRVDYHFLMVVNGSGHAYCNNEIHSLKKGELVIYSPSEIQEYDFIAGTTTMWVHFCGRIIGEIFEELGLKSGVYDASGNNFIYSSFASMIRNFNCSERLKFSNADLLELLYNISDLKNEASQNKYNEIILPVLAYINENYNKKITVSELADKIGYSKSRFSHIFSDITGTTPVKYQNEIRLKTACEYLSSTNLTIKNIAISCGFNDPLYFCRIFKKKYNMTPGEFRNRH